MPPTKIVSGRILFQGEDLLKKSEKEIGDIRGTRIAMIFQDPMTYLNPVFSIEKQMVDVIVRHCRQRGKPITRKEAGSRAVELLDAVHKTPERRKTRSGRTAAVYVAGPAVKPEPAPAVEPVQMGLLR